MSKGSILVVDDETEIREGLEMLLTSEGYGVSSAETGASGLAKLEERPFDLLLLDVSLPDRNGLDLLREIRLRDPRLPDFIDDVLLRNLQLGEACVDLRVRRVRDQVALDIVRTQGKMQVSVVLSA